MHAALRVNGETLSYTVKKAQGLEQELWPVGLTPQEGAQKVLPALYDLHNVNVSGVTASKLLEVVARPIQGRRCFSITTPWHGTASSPTRRPFRVPEQRTSYSIAMRKMLGKIGLKFEVRVDEAGKPFRVGEHGEAGVVITALSAGPLRIQ